ncbi:MAG: hypothetical protein ACI351_04125 [Candidatus Avelusimicrobium sp.]|uniref:hypothetical protein n=1 Tax=Candidatus Avelusimicrobium sp. TaxID=3048833 RepID=UPI003F11FC67
MRLTLYKWKEVLLKLYLTHVRGCGYAFSYWPYVSVRKTPSGLDVSFKGRKLFSALSLAKLQKSGQDVYILASGPSVQKQDLSYLCGKNVITLNGSVSAAVQHGFTPLLHLISDANFILKRPQLVKAVPAGVPIALSLSAVKAAAVFVPDLFSGRKLFPILNPLETFPNPPIPAERLAQDKFKINRIGTSAFSLDPLAGLQDGGSVLTIAVQLAYFLQFKRVFLLGFDIGNAAEPRFYETKQNRLKCGLLEDYEREILPFMKLAAEVFRSAGREIYNCSPVTKLPYDVIPYFEYPEES